MIPVLFLGMAIGLLFNSLREKPSVNGIQTVDTTKLLETRVQGEDSPYLEEFTRVIRKGRRPSEWLITQAINDACMSHKWDVARSISDNYPFVDAPKKAVKEKVEGEESEKEETHETKFLASKTSSPIDGIPTDDWQMFVAASNVESPEFNTENSFGMFRQNKKRLAKLGIEASTDPVKQYEAFEAEGVQLAEEGKELSKLHVAMPIDVAGESVPITLSGLLAVMRSAGTKNAEKWLDSDDERKKFPHTTDAFKKANGCF